VRETMPWVEVGQFWAALKPLRLERVSQAIEGHIVTRAWSPSSDAEEYFYLEFTPELHRHLWFEKHVPAATFGESFQTRLKLKAFPGDVILASPDIEYVPPPPPPAPPGGYTAIAGSSVVMLTGGSSLIGGSGHIQVQSVTHKLFFIGPETNEKTVQVLADWNPFPNASHYGLKHYQKSKGHRSLVGKTDLERISEDDE
jgi:hypothetical protein